MGVVVRVPALLVDILPQRRKGGLLAGIGGFRFLGCVGGGAGGRGKEVEVGVGVWVVRDLKKMTARRQRALLLATAKNCAAEYRTSGSLGALSTRSREQYLPSVAISGRLPASSSSSSSNSKTNLEVASVKYRCSSILFVRLQFRYLSFFHFPSRSVCRCSVPPPPLVWVARSCSLPRR